MADVVVNVYLAFQPFVETLSFSRERCISTSEPFPFWW